MSENVAIEEETHDLPIGVGIRDLRKVFKVLQSKMGFHSFINRLWFSQIISMYYVVIDQAWGHDGWILVGEYGKGHILLNYGERRKDTTDHRSYTHSLSSCEI